MRYSLLSRFQGVLIGAALGELLGTRCHRQRRQEKSHSWLKVDDWGFNPSRDSGLPGWGAVVVDGIQQLTVAHRWDLQPLVGKGEASEVQRHGYSGLAIAALPLMLYFHDDLDQLKTQIQQAIAIWQPDDAADPEVLSSVLVVGYAIAFALREELNPSQFIPDLLTALDGQALVPMVHQLLLQVQTLATERPSLAIATTRLTQTYLPHHPGLFELAILLHSLLAVPQDVRLSLLHVAQVSQQPQIACAVMGAIAGAYNSVAGLPIDWRRKLKPYSNEPSALFHLWAVSSESDLLLLADGLLASWSGVYDPQRYSGDITLALAIAAPDVMRS
jgi:ADP-ribosylglycohydrolase